ncbi:MAG TPA: hypothetical protein VFV86_11065, partial [Nitrososphaeraceae archaeon]|nr:hypothetical protein [Nitrososphaeraceae archaeon]
MKPSIKKNNQKKRTGYIMKEINTDGICFYCSKSYSGIIMMIRHLESCEKRKNFYLDMNKKLNKSEYDNNNK